jgi:hypothetical protein
MRPPLCSISYINFREFRKREVRRIPILHTSVNKGIREGRSVFSPGHGESTSASSSVM